MTEELKEKLNPISDAFFDWLKELTIENWCRPIEEPIEKFVTYDDDNGFALSELYKEYENDEETIKEIDKYLNQIVRNVNNLICC